MKSTNYFSFSFVYYDIYVYSVFMLGSNSGFITEKKKFIIKFKIYYKKKMYALVPNFF